MEHETSARNALKGRDTAPEGTTPSDPEAAEAGKSKQDDEVKNTESPKNVDPPNPPEQDGIEQKDRHTQRTRFSEKTQGRLRDDSGVTHGKLSEHAGQTNPAKYTGFF